jgi:hypothetical protein
MNILRKETVYYETIFIACPLLFFDLFADDNFSYFSNATSIAKNKQKKVSEIWLHAI